MPSKFSSQFAAIVDVQTRIGDKVSPTWTDVFDLALGQAESATSRLVELEDAKNKAVDLFSELKSA